MPASSALAGSPSIASRSLGRLLRLDALHFKVEACQPTGSWLDRSAAALVASAVGEGQTGLGVVGVNAWTLPLAVQCARVGLRLVILEPAERDGKGAAPGVGLPGLVDPRERGWLAALGARTVAVAADLARLSEAAPSVMRQAGLRPVAASEPSIGAGLLEVLREIDAAGHGQHLLAVPSLTGHEARWLLADHRRRSGAVPLPLDDLAPSVMGRPVGIVGALGLPAVAAAADTGGLDAAEAHDGSVPLVSVSVREVEAARRLLAGEEGLLVSRRGGAGLAALVRALREDRARRPRERRLRDVTAAVVVLTGEPMRASDGPPLAADAVQRRPVSLAALSSDLSRLLVEPPGR